MSTDNNVGSNRSRRFSYAVSLIAGADGLVPDHPEIAPVLGKQRLDPLEVIVRSWPALALLPQDGHVILRGKSQDPLRLFVEELGLRTIAKDKEDLVQLAQECAED
jgi:hypothetical protein